MSWCFDILQYHQTVSDWVCQCSAKVPVAARQIDCFFGCLTGPFLQFLSYNPCLLPAPVQVSTVKEEIEKLRGRLANKDNEDAETLKTATDELQQKSLKLFEVAYRKVSNRVVLCSGG